MTLKQSILASNNNHAMYKIRKVNDGKYKICCECILRTKCQCISSNITVLMYNISKRITAPCTLWAMTMLHFGKHVSDFIQCVHYYNLLCYCVCSSLLIEY